MNARLIAPLVVFLLVGGGAASPQSLSDCRKLTGGVERLDCYDKLSEGGEEPKTATPKPPPKPASADDKMITAAKAAVAKQLLDASSARYTNVSVKPAKDGARGVCGQVNAKNSFGGYSGPRLFVFDGKFARILISEMGASNPSSFPRELIGTMLGDSLKMYERFCEKK